jgi:cytosine/adenosine deaminase-related metal-dependent hydrolase
LVGGRGSIAQKRAPAIRALAEVATITARHGGRTPAEYLDRLGLLAPDRLAAPCIASTDGDLKLMAARGATVLNWPRVFARADVAAAHLQPLLIHDAD